MHRVASRDDWARIRALRYQALVEHGDICERAELAYVDGHDLAMNTSTFLLARSGRVLGSVRTSVSAPNRRWALPAMEVFEDAIKSAVGLEATVVEASLLVVDPQTALDRRIVALHAMKAGMLECATQNADWLLTAVRDDEIGFHRRMLEMEILSGPESWPGMDRERILMGLDYRRHSGIVFGRFPLLAVSLADEVEYAASGVVRFPQRALSQQAA